MLVVKFSQCGGASSSFPPILFSKSCANVVFPPFRFVSPDIVMPKLVFFPSFLPRKDDTKFSRFTLPIFVLFYFFRKLF